MPSKQLPKWSDGPQFLQIPRTDLSILAYLIQVGPTYYAADCSVMAWQLWEFLKIYENSQD